MLMNKILRYSFVALLAMVFGNVMADKVTMAYPSGTTTNMTGNNDAALVGLNADEWSVVAAKGGSNNFPGLNKAGDIRLYYHANGSNTITVESLSGATINSITATFNSATYSNMTVTVNGNPVTGTDGTFTINSTSFVLGNGNTSNVQVQIKSLVINYSASGDTRTATTIEFADGYEQWFAPSGPFDETYPVAAATVKANGTPIDAIVTWTVEKKDDWAAYEGEGELTVADGKVSGIHKKSFGTLTLTASFAGDQANKPSTKSYDIKVCKIPNRIQDFYEWYGNKKENIAIGMPVCYFLIDLDEYDTPTPRQELVTYVKGANTYITDGKQGLLLYKTNLGLAVGDKIMVAGATKADPIWGTLKSFNGTIEIAVDHMGVVKTSTGNEVTPIEITVDKITALDNFFTNWQGGKMTPLIENVFLSNYVTIKDAEYVGTSGSNEQFKVGDATFLVYKNGANITFEATAKYTLTGVGSSYNKSGDITPQLNYISSVKTAEASVNAIKSNAQFSGKMYNTAGQVVNKGYKGLVIQDGRKYVNK